MPDETPTSAYGPPGPNRSTRTFHGPATEAHTPAAPGNTLDPNQTTDVPARPDESAPLPAFPGYEILEELGRGGMGVVYRARQTALNRIVALKMIRSAAGASGSEVTRFLAEAEAVAAIRHPNVVQVFECGKYAGQPYMALEYLPGGTLSSLLHDGKMAVRPAAEMVASIAAGVQAAHEQGIVHRDLKPANILLSAKGRHSGEGERRDSASTLRLEDTVPKVTDFGIARRGTSDLTATGAVVGTPHYMAPEQAAGQAKFVGPAADVYALGVILYECLTGEVPFRGQDAWSVIRQVMNDPPTRPRKLTSGVPRDLELICLKCLEKEPHHRYASASELEADLRRFLAGQPVTARPLDPASRVWRTVKRNPVIVGAVVAVLLSSAIGTAVSLVKADEAERNAKTAKENEGRANDNAQIAQTNEKIAKENEEKAKKALLARDAAEDLKIAAFNDREKAFQDREKALESQLQAEREVANARADALAASQKLERNARVALYALNLDLARRALAAGDVASTEQSLAACPQEVRGWEWRLVNQWLARKTSPLPKPEQFFKPLCVAASPDGRWLAAAGLGARKPGAPVGPFGSEGTKMVWLWDLKAGGPPKLLGGELGQIVPKSLAFDPAGKQLAALCFDGPRVWDLADPSKPAIERKVAMGYGTMAMQITATRVFAVAGTFDPNAPVQLLSWPIDGKDPEPTKGDLAFGAQITAAAIAPDGETVVLAGPTPNPLAPIDAPPAKAVLFTADGKIRGEPVTFVGIPLVAAFSPDGKRVAVASENRATSGLGLTLFDSATGKNARSVSLGTGVLVSLELREDKALASVTVLSPGVTPGELRVCNLNTGRIEMQAKFGPSSGCAFLADGKRYVTCDHNAGVRIYDPVELHSRTVIRLGGTSADSTAFLPGDTFAAFSMSGPPAVTLEPARGGAPSTFTVDQLDAGYVAVAAAGEKFALWATPVGGKPGAVVLYDSKKKAVVHRWPTPQQAPGVLAMSAKYVAFGGKLSGLNPLERKIVLHDPDTGKLEHTLPLIDDRALPQGLAFSANGNYLACAQMRIAKKIVPGEPLLLPGCLTVWNAATGKVAWSADKLPEGAYGVGFSADSTLVAVSCGDSRVRLYQTADGKPVREFSVPANSFGSPVLSLGFSPDATRLAGVSGEALTVWDVASGQMVLSVPQGGTWVAFLANGRALAMGATGTHAGRVLVYDPGP